MIFIFSLHFFQIMLELSNERLVINQTISKDTLLFKIPGVRVACEFEDYYNINQSKTVDENIIAERDEKLGFVTFKPDSSNDVWNRLQEAHPSQFSAFPQISYKVFRDFYNNIKTYDKLEHNSKIIMKVVSKQPEFWVSSNRDIDAGSEIIVQLGNKYWMRKLLLKSDNPLQKLVLLIFLEAFNYTEFLSEK